MDSELRFSDGARYRIEIPSVDEAADERPADLGVPEVVRAPT